MGYKLPKRTAHVAFEEGHAFHGLEVELSLSVPLATTFELARLGKNAREDAEPFIRAFAQHVLVSWNVEDDNGPVPATPDGVVGALTQDVLLELFEQWKDAQGVSAPLEQPSSEPSTSAPVPLMRTVSG